MMPPPAHRFLYSAIDVLEETPTAISKFYRHWDIFFRTSRRKITFSLYIYLWVRVVDFFQVI